MPTRDPLAPRDSARYPDSSLTAKCSGRGSRRNARNGARSHRADQRPRLPTVRRRPRKPGSDAASQPRHVTRLRASARPAEPARWPVLPHAAAMPPLRRQPARWMLPERIRRGRNLEKPSRAAAPVGETPKPGHLAATAMRRRTRRDRSGGAPVPTASPRPDPARPRRRVRRASPRTAATGHRQPVCFQWFPPGSPDWIRARPVESEWSDQSRSRSRR